MLRIYGYISFKKCGMLMASIEIACEVFKPKL